MGRSTARWVSMAALGLGIAGALGSTAWADDKSERVVPLIEVPDAARASIENQAQGGIITKVEEITKHGQIMAYEADVMINGRQHEVKVDPNGRLLKFEREHEHERD